MSCNGTMRSFDPLPNTFTCPLPKSTLAASRPDASDTRAPHAYRNSSRARFRASTDDCSRSRPAASRLPYTVSSFTMSDARMTCGRLFGCLGPCRMLAGSSSAMPVTLSQRKKLRSADRRRFTVVREYCARSSSPR